MPITDSRFTIQSSTFKKPQKSPTLEQSKPNSEHCPSDTFTFSGGRNAGWKIAVITTMLAAVPLGIASKNLAAGAMVGLVGVGLMFGPDN